MNGTPVGVTSIVRFQGVNAAIIARGYWECVRFLRYVVSLTRSEVC